MSKTSLKTIYFVGSSVFKTLLILFLQLITIIIVFAIIMISSSNGLSSVSIGVLPLALMLTMSLKGNAIIFYLIVVWPLFFFYRGVVQGRLKLLQYFIANGAMTSSYNTLISLKEIMIELLANKGSAGRLDNSGNNKVERLLASFITLEHIDKILCSVNEVPEREREKRILNQLGSRVSFLGDRNKIIVFMAAISHIVLISLLLYWFFLV